MKKPDSAKSESNSPTQPSTLAAALDWATQLLQSSGVDNPAVDAQILLAELLGLSRGELSVQLILGAELNFEHWQSFQDFISRRANREPLQHILGFANFRTIQLEVGPGVFVPRVETELLVELGIAELAKSGLSKNPLILDLGTGSGAVALAIATELETAQVIAIEKSDSAFSWASKNFSRYLPSLNRRAELRLADFTEITLRFPELIAQADLILSNPPYIPLAEVPETPEVKDYDPELALYGGADGLELIRSLISEAELLLKPGGSFIFEHFETQGAEIKKLFNPEVWHEFETISDLTGADRFSKAVKH